MTAVAVTGMGAVTSCGATVQETWSNIVDGKSGAKSLERFPTYELGTRVGAPAVGHETEPPGGFTLSFTESALKEALSDAGLVPGAVDAVVLSNHGERRMPTTADHGSVASIQTVSDAAREFAGATHAMTVYGACAGGGLAIGSALRLLQAGQAQTVVAGGADCLLRDYDFYQFCNLYAMSTRECLPEEASCPFDVRRDGFVLSEGAAFLVLERLDHAQQRGVRPRAILAGYGSSQNAYHLIASPPDGLGPAAAMAAAVKDAGLSCDEVSYINAHGTSTRDNDWCETLAIHKVFGSHADKLLVSSTKSMMGHPMAAAGAIEAVVTVKTIETGVVPPTINLIEQDPRCDLDYVPGQSRTGRIRYAMSNSFGFGGHNTALVFAAV